MLRKALLFLGGIFLALGAPASQAQRDMSALKPPAGSHVALIEFADLECPMCARQNPTLKDAAAKYKVPLVRHDFPLQMHVWSFQAAVNGAVGRGEAFLDDAAHCLVHDQRACPFGARLRTAGRASRRDRRSLRRRRGCHRMRPRTCDTGRSRRLISPGGAARKQQTGVAGAGVSRKSEGGRGRPTRVTSHESLSCASPNLASRAWWEDAGQS